MATTIRVSDELRDRLKTAGQMGDSYEHVISQALDALANQRSKQVNAQPTAVEQ